MYNNEFNQRPMKRSHSPDLDNNNFRGGFRGHPGHHHQFNKRHRGDGSNFIQPQTIEDKIARLGDTGSRNTDIGILAKDIDADLSSKLGDLDEKIKTVTTKICKCIVSFPTRLATYASLVGLISVKHYNLSCQIINTLYASYPIYLEAQKWREAMTIMHALATLVNCNVIQPSALLEQFKSLLDVIEEENVPQARSDYYVYTVLSSLPYVALELSQKVPPEDFEKLLNTIEVYLSKRTKEHLPAIRVWLSSDSTLQMDYLESLWVQTKNFRSNNWNETFLHRPYNDKEYKDNMFTSSMPQNPTVIQVPPHSPDYIYPSPRIVFRLFEDDAAEGHRHIPGSDKIERFCIESHIKNIIDELPKETRDCARHLSHMYRSDQLPMKHMLIETILGELFTLPKLKHPEIVYHSLLFELSKVFYPSKNPDELKSNFEFILNEAVTILYSNLDTMNVTCFDRFVTWFSFHLNNNEFLYPWQSWADATLKEESSPKTVFVREILDHSIRFSFHKKISTLVSNNLANLVPAEVGVKYNPVYKDNAKAEELSATIKKLILEKAIGPLICETLNIMIEGVELPDGFMIKEEKHLDKLLKIDIFTAVILSIASKSLTHLSSAIGKYKNVFKSLAKIDGGQIQLLQTIHSCLESHPQLQVILVDKLLKAELVEANEVCNWIFSDSMKPYLLRCYPWELLNNTIYRSAQALEKLIKERDQPPEVAKNEAGEDIEMKVETNTELDDKIKESDKSLQDLLFQVFSSFATIIGEHIRKCEASNSSFMDNWYRWITGRMQQVYYYNYELLVAHYEQLTAIIDKTPSIMGSIVNLNC